MSDYEQAEAKLRGIFEAMTPGLGRQEFALMTIALGQLAIVDELVKLRKLWEQKP